MSHERSDRNIKDIVRGMGLGSNIITRICEEVERRRIPAGLIHQLDRPGNEEAIKAMVNALVENLPPEVMEIKMPTRKFNPMDHVCMAGTVGFSRPQVIADAVSRIGAFEDDGRLETTFCIVRFWKGWSWVAILETAAGMGLSVPCMRLVVCFAEYMAAHPDFSVPNGFPNDDVLMVLEPTDNSGDVYGQAGLGIFDDRRGHGNGRGFPSVEPIPLRPVNPTLVADGLATEYPFLFVKKQE